MASMKDVAKHAQVGMGTVSRFFNNTGYISEATKLKIAKAIKELDYTPNQLARNLASNSSGLIGVIVPNIEHPFFATFVKHVEIKLYSLGYKTLICNTIGISDREKLYLEMLDRNMVDGIITCSQTLDNELYSKSKKPIVSLDHDFGPSIPIVYSDHTKGGQLAAEQIINAGCKNVIQFMTPASIHTPSNDRHVVFEKILREHNIPITTYESEWNIFEYDYFYNMFKKKLCPSKKYDGIFVADFGAICCLKIAQKNGLSVPDDIKIVGYDGLTVTEYTTPCITTVSQNIIGLAASCVEIIIKRIQNKSNIPSKTILDVTLKNGGSI